MLADAQRPEMRTGTRSVERFLARRGARVGMWILAVLATLSAWAPFLANDEPYTITAADHGAVQRARRELVPLAESIAESDAQGRRSAAELRAFEQRVDALESAAGSTAGSTPGSTGLHDVRVELSALRTRDASPASAERLVAAARDARESLVGRELSATPMRSFPLFASLDGVDVFVALLPIAGACAYVARRRAKRFDAVARSGASPAHADARRRASPQRAFLVAGCVAFAIGAIVHFAGSESPFRAPGALKAAVASGSLQVESAIFPPIPFGYAETNLTEAWRPPTWLAIGRMDADGRYVVGRRASEPTAGKLLVRFAEPAFDAPSRHVLGTDALGRDVAARVLWGGRISLAIGFAAAVLLSVIGMLLGAAAGFFGGRIDASISRTVEVVLCFPAFFLVLCAIAWSDPDVVPIPIAIVLVIAAVGWTSTARLVRAEALRVAASDHVLAARALGVHPLRVLTRHVLPNSVGPALIAFGFAAGGAIGVESSLAFLGLGAQVPVPSWGGLVGEARGADQAWAWIAPGFLVFLAVLAWVLVAESAREALDPRASIGGAP